MIMNKLSTCLLCFLPGFWLKYPVRKNSNTIDLVPLCPVCVEKRKLNEELCI